MNKISNKFSAIVVAAFLLCVSAFAYAGNGATLVPFIPNDAKAVISVDIAAVRTSETLDQLLRTSGAEAQLARVTGRLDTVGFNPRQQVDTALVIANSFSKDSKPLIIVEGASIPRTQIEQALTREGTATRTTVGQITVFTRGTRGSIAFLANDIAVIGPTAQVNAVARIAAGEARSTPNATLAREIGRADRTKNLWFAALPPADMVKGTPLEGSRAVRGAANVRTNLELVIDGVMASEAAAASSAESSRAQLTAMGNRDEVAALGLAQVIQSVNIAPRGESVRLTLNLDQNRFRRLLNTVLTVIRDQMQ